MIPMGNRLLEIVAATTFGLLLGLAGYGLWLSSQSGSEPDPTSSVTEPADTLIDTGDKQEQPTDWSDLSAAYERSRTATFALDGVLARDRPGQASTVAVRQARAEGRSLDEIGTIAIVTSNEFLRRCELIAGRVLCTNPEPAASVDQEVAAFNQLISGPDAIYSVYETDPVEAQAALGAVPSTQANAVDCWSLIAVEVGLLGQYGDETLICFETQSGVLVGRITRNGDATDTFAVTDLRFVVDQADLEPTGA